MFNFTTKDAKNTKGKGKRKGESRASENKTFDAILPLGVVAVDEQSDLRTGLEGRSTAAASLS